MIGAYRHAHKAAELSNIFWKVDWRHNFDRAKALSASQITLGRESLWTDLPRDFIKVISLLWCFSVTNHGSRVCSCPCFRVYGYRDRRHRPEMYHKVKCKRSKNKAPLACSCQYCRRYGITHPSSPITTTRNRTTEGARSYGESDTPRGPRAQSMHSKQNLSLLSPRTLENTDCYIHCPEREALATLCTLLWSLMGDAGGFGG